MDKILSLHCELPSIVDTVNEPKAPWPLLDSALDFSWLSQADVEQGPGCYSADHIPPRYMSIVVGQGQ